MAVEYRPVRLEELRDRVYNAQVAFGRSTDESLIEQRAERMRLEEPLEWTLAAFDGGVLASKMTTLPFVISWNGREVGCGGVAGVTTLPTHRRRGYLRELMRRAFATMRDAKQPVAMLWASMAAIYQRFGYGAGWTNRTYRFDPRLLRFVDEIPVNGRVRLVKDLDATKAIAGAYAQFAAQRMLMLRRDREVIRGEPWWTEQFRRWRPEMPPRLVAVYEEGDDVLGYAIYDVEQHSDWQPGPDQEVIVGELVWLQPAAHRALIRYLTSYDLARTITIEHVPVDDPLFFQAQEPRLLNATAGDGSLLRIVDVQAALEARGYDQDGHLVLNIDDELCPWNSGVWQITVEASSARVARSTADPELSLTPRALALLVSGHLQATTLAHMGLLTAVDARRLTVADQLFRTAYAPLCLDHF